MKKQIECLKRNLTRKIYKQNKVKEKKILRNEKKTNSSFLEENFPFILLSIEM